MEAVRTRREAVALGFFGVVVVAVTLMTGYQLFSDAPKGREAHVQDQTAALRNRAAQLEAALRTNPRDVDTMVALGDAYLELRQGEQALAVFEKAQVLAPDNIHVLSDLGSIYQQTGRYDEALEKFGRVVELDPTRLGALVHMGIIYRYRKGDDAKALEIFRDVLARNPDPRLAEMARREIAKIEAQQGGKGK